MLRPALGLAGRILRGNPGFYRRFGFALAPPNLPSIEPESSFKVRLFTGAMPTGTAEFHEAFYNKTGDGRRQGRI